MSDLTYGVIGTGAIGGFYGGILGDLGKKVNFLLHSDYEHVKEKGFFIDSEVFGKIQCKGNFFNSVLEMPPCDVILVGLKTTQNHLLKELLPPVLKEGSIVILVQNGLGAEEDLKSQFPDISVAGGVAQILSFKKAPGWVVHQQLGNLALGAYGDKEIPLLSQVTEDFNLTGRISCIQRDLALSRWTKLVWNIPFNGLSVVLNARTDVMIRDKNIRKLVKEMMEEVVKGAAKCGVNLPGRIVSDQIRITEEMTSYSPSMKLDFENNRPMEIRYMYERPVEIAERHGYYMSKVDMLASQLRFFEEKEI